MHWLDSWLFPQSMYQAYMQKKFQPKRWLILLIILLPIPRPRHQRIPPLIPALKHRQIKPQVKKATATKKQTVKIKKYKKSKKLYVKKATKAYKVTSTGKLKAAKSLKKSAKVTVVGTAKVKKVKYYAIKSGKSTMLVKQSLLSKTKPKTAKPSSKPSTNSSKHPTPQNNTPSGYTKPKNDIKVNKNGDLIPASIKSVKVVNGKVEYRDGTIKYAKYKIVDGHYCYWYSYRGDGVWIPIEMTNLRECGIDYVDEMYEDAHGTVY